MSHCVALLPSSMDEFLNVVICAGIRVVRSGNRDGQGIEGGAADAVAVRLAIGISRDS